MSFDVADAKAVAARFKIESGPYDYANGMVLWVELGIEYRIANLAPDVKIVAPVIWEDGKTLSQVKSEAFAAFSALLNHAASCDLQGLPSELPIEPISPGSDD